MESRLSPCIDTLFFSFPAESFCSAISAHARALKDPTEKSSFLALIKPVMDAAAPYANCSKPGTGGPERVLQGFLNLLRKWIDIERWFCDGKPYADIVDFLRKSNKDNYQHVLEACRSHCGLPTTTGIMIRIIDAIAEAMRSDSTEKASYTSVVAGAQSLGDVVPCLSEIGSMASSEYSLVSLKARKLLLQENLPSFESRKERISQTVKVLGSAITNSKEQTPDDVTNFLDENVPLTDVLYPLLRSATDDGERLALVELYLRQLYRTQSLKDFERDPEQSCVKFMQTAKQSEQVFDTSTSVSSMVELKRQLSHSSMERMNNSDNRQGDAPASSPRIAVAKLTDSTANIQSVAAFEKILSSFPQFMKSLPKCESGPRNVLYIVVLNEKIDQEPGAMDKRASQLESILAFFKEQLEQADIGRVSFVFDYALDIDEYRLPSIFTYRAQYGYKEDTLFRNIEPVYAHQLHLNRLAKNFTVERLDYRQTSKINVHLYKATPRPVAIEEDKKANKSPRIFVRALSYIIEFTSTSFEKMLVDSLNALDIKVHEQGFCKDNHLFMNLDSDYERIMLDPVLVEQTVVNVLKRHGGRISALGVTEVETRLVCRLDADSPPIAVRMVASNPTGYVHVMNTYIEAADTPLSEPVFKLIGGAKGNLASSGDSSWEGMKISSPYPLTRPFDAQRNAALRASDSLYCYDLPALFEAAVEQQWSYALEREGIEIGVGATSRPLMVTYTSELVVQKKKDLSASWTMADYMDDELELVQTQRKAGSNDVGMVAWLMTLNTVEYPKVSSITSLFQISRERKKLF